MRTPSAVAWRALLFTSTIAITHTIHMVLICNTGGPPLAADLTAVLCSPVPLLQKVLFPSRRVRDEMSSCDRGSLVHREPGTERKEPHCSARLKVPYAPLLYIKEPGR